ncbi:hypothetical protein GNI_070250 [Gregarina niphandrodes]|uniref:Uncharacterized protein n=1 Tax=Gregarina niphandrodes TaxID=110365 RepID=A0A023B7F1_GRENI|nr:hypothetical protein GNI_070250 [Gregarina niphandrodes]EZG67239.1 hypothetical protein GNI_070250 [Gregarina niphandrodes]|eukprot:XP_011130284.1 hypothetical protein GNI_070250 [Gregarina niphandrodes]
MLLAILAGERAAKKANPTTRTAHRVSVPLTGRVQPISDAPIPQALAQHLEHKGLTKQITHDISRNMASKPAKQAFETRQKTGGTQLVNATDSTVGVNPMSPGLEGTGTLIASPPQPRNNNFTIPINTQPLSNQDSLYN